jgi:hypothetical protein
MPPNSVVPSTQTRELSQFSTQWPSRGTPSRVFWVIRVSGGVLGRVVVQGVWVGGLRGLRSAGLLATDHRVFYTRIRNTANVDETKPRRQVRGNAAVV